MSEENQTQNHETYEYVVLPHCFDRASLFTISILSIKWGDNVNNENLKH